MLEIEHDVEVPGLERRGRGDLHHGVLALGPALERVTKAEHSRRDRRPRRSPPEPVDGSLEARVLGVRSCRFGGFVALGVFVHPHIVRGRGLDEVVERSDAVARLAPICEAPARFVDAHRAGGLMAAGLILEFEGVTMKEYDAVNAALGIDTKSGTGDWPDGLVTHSAGLNEDGHLVVMEVWDTPEHQATFMETRLGEALGKGGITGPPSSVTWIELESHHHPGG